MGKKTHFLLLSPHLQFLLLLHLLLPLPRLSFLLLFSTIVHGSPLLFFQLVSPSKNR